MGPVTAVAFDLRQSDPKSRPTPAQNLGPGLSLANSAPSKTDAARRSTGPYSVSGPFVTVRPAPGDDHRRDSTEIRTLANRAKPRTGGFAHMTACDDRAPTSLDRSISPVTATSAAALKRPSRTASSHHFAPAVTNARAGNSPRGRPGHSRLSGASEPPSSPSAHFPACVTARASRFNQLCRDCPGLSTAGHAIGPRR